MRVIDGKRNKSVQDEPWRDAFEVTQTNKKGITKRFNRCEQSLQNAKKVEIFDPFVWVIWSDSDQNDSDF
jgi:hypothetical protein